MRYDIEVIEAFRTYHVGGECDTGERMWIREVS